ncbi:hypothetical protein CLV24_108103 [Pontibacter ummariensis]|uniref:Uncharacterized protein n=1 Tax=Pontibacter ummariensis TaxID=1610492 RepID=A0A239F976_9BACT|nr:hypothetical protein [Pontibacter ummariensis]PRY12359.1 hypothetical protein CLV24_108103 [Pontibacter ummariensis]SNS53600.1 hypothetical protein SAMN06296052_10882 [Pontibacter ummariensis]
MNKFYRIAPLLLLLLCFYGCQQRTEEEGSIASTHPELAEELAEDPLEMPISDNENPDLYQQYRITLEEYLGSGDYDVGDMYRGRLAPLDEASHVDARTYRTALREGLEAGVNFAGSYTVVTVGCGSSCQLHYVVDRETGKVLDKLQSSVGADYRPDSRLFVLNPPDSAINYNECQYCAPEAYVFENGKFEKLPDVP